jgi:hypothetical protein
MPESLGLRRRNSKVFSNLSSQVVVDFGMARHGRGFSRGTDSRTPNGCRLLAVTRSRAPQDIERALGVSHTNFQRFTNDFTSLGCLLNQFPIRFEHQSNGLLKICTGFLKCGTLRIRTRDLLDEADIALWYFLKFRSQVQLHSLIIRPGRHEA